MRRSHVITVECQAAFKSLTVKTRVFRDRRFKPPPLAEGDRAALGFRAKAPRQRPRRTGFPRRLWLSDLFGNHAARRGGAGTGGV
jgi:hypothetical protein